MKTFTKHSCVYQENGHIQFLCVCLYTHTQVTQTNAYTYFLSVFFKCLCFSTFKN